jgi:hypothetical protein
MLFRLNLPQLNHVYVLDIGISNDIVKVVTKNWTFYKKIGIQSHKGFQHM